MRTALTRSVLLAVCAAAGLWIHANGWDSLADLGRFFYGTPHQRYSARLRISSGVDAQRWLDAADAAIERPQILNLPTQLTVSPGGDGLAGGYAVSLRRGQRYVLEAAADQPDQVFIDVFRKIDDDVRPVMSGGKDDTTVALEIREDGEYIVRVQQTLEARSRITLTLRAEPALSLPVLGAQSKSIQSFFGAVRDGGRRSHHGVDIFARRGTPVTAAADGFVTSVGTNGLGGNVVWIARIGHGERHYYAHLDEQLVSAGQWVTRGDVIGTVGNTGNARTTAPHLHFGIYGREGPVDPLPYIRPTDSRRRRESAVDRGTSLAPSRSWQTIAIKMTS